MSAPTVSVIMAVYNGAAVIGEAIDSLIAQRFKDFEVVIVDDGSTDRTRELLRSISDSRFRIIEAPINAGAVHARNLAFAETRGKYIAALDHDDICHPDRFAMQVAYLDTHPDTVLVATATQQLYEGSIRPSALPAMTSPALVEWMLWICNPIVWSSVMLRSNAARELVPFTRPERLYAEDFDLYHRLSDKGRIAQVDTELLTYRSHAGGVSQRFIAAMEASATQVFVDQHRELLGDEVTERAALLVQHVMRQTPVPDRATLMALGETIMTLQHAFLEHIRPADADIRLIRWGTARLWARIGRAALRSGMMGLADIVAVRPNHLGLGYASLNDLVVSAVVGGVRNASQSKARVALG
ncbi:MULTISPECIES: glycosyltransferase family A protein [unclassified Sphingomonas]|uniref:glycosyltransferase family 2 protein n=1 Tax=unclassified Sphingomonas TaxID=196159 RepID=UPI000BC774FE|nr:MAG: glycosyl transferase family 2 [Sphingomonas sp. 32-62-10]